MITQLRCLFATILVAAAGVDCTLAAHTTDTSVTSGNSSANLSVEQRLRALSLDEKLALIGGSGFSTTPIPRLSIPAFRMTDGPAGVRSPSPSTAFPSGISLAATWDPQLARDVGLQMGRDARSRGLKFLLAPGVNISRSPLNGRNFEYYGEDPMLSSRLAVEFIKGVQSQGVSATIKHFVANESEFARHWSDSFVEQRALREIYLPVFEAAVKQAHVGAVMSSYNLLNGIRTTAHPELIRILKREWGFDGVYMSDWGATYDGAAAARAGLDLEMPAGTHMNPEAMKRALKDGSISEADINDKVRRLLNLADRFGWLSTSDRDLSIPAYNQAGKAAAFQHARESMVLLKNRDNLLPLDPAHTSRIAVIGPNAHPAVIAGGGSGRVFGFPSVSLLQGISDRLGKDGRVTYASGIRSLKALALSTPFMLDATNQQRGIRVETFADETLQGPAIAKRTEARFETGVAGFGTELFDAIDTLPSEEVLAQLSEAMSKRSNFERWSTTFTPQAGGSHTLFVQSSVQYRLLIDGQVIIDASRFSKAALQQQRLTLVAKPHSIVFEQAGKPEVGRPFWRVGIVRDETFVDPAAIELAKQADAVVLSLGFNAESESEAMDREFNLPPGQVELIKAIVGANKRTLVVLNSGGSVELESWIEDVPALLAAWYPGQEGGTALAQLVFGDVSPSGRLPISWERKLADSPSRDSYYFNDPTHPNRIVYRDGVFVGYRGLQKADVKPAFSFGFGLSYSTFSYGNAQLRPLRTHRTSHSALYEISFDVTNTGPRLATDVAQVYVAPVQARVPRPERELKEFARVDLAPGTTKRVLINLDARSFAYFDVANNRWRVDAGEYVVEIGRSVEDIREQVRLVIDTPINIPMES